MEDYSRYISILIASLEKKNELLSELLELNERQAEILKEEIVPEDEFERIIDKKQDRIELIAKVDTGFDSIYRKARTEITQNPEKYKDEIHLMQDLIKELTDKSVKMEASEKRNKMAVDFYLSKERKSAQNLVRTVDAANSYYKSMTGTQVVDAQMFNLKK